MNFKLKMVTLGLVFAVSCGFSAIVNSGGNAVYAELTDSEKERLELLKSFLNKKCASLKDAVKTKNMMHFKIVFAELFYFICRLRGEDDKQHKQLLDCLYGHELEETKDKEHAFERLISVSCMTEIDKILDGSFSDECKERINSVLQDMIIMVNGMFGFVTHSIEEKVPDYNAELFLKHYGEHMVPFIEELGFSVKDGTFEDKTQKIDAIEVGEQNKQALDDFKSGLSLYARFFAKLGTVSGMGREQSKDQIRRVLLLAEKLRK